VLGPIVRGYYIMTQDKRAYLALQDPATGKVCPSLCCLHNPCLFAYLLYTQLQGDLTTSTDPTQAVRFFVDPNFFGLQAPVAIYTISAAGGLVTLVPPPKHITGTLGNVSDSRVTLTKQLLICIRIRFNFSRELPPMRRENRSSGSSDLTLQRYQEQPTLSAATARH